MVDSGETCDDGNNVNGDGCSATCTSEGVVVATDSFSRAVDGGWGTADLGGPWSDFTSAPDFSFDVNGSSGVISLGGDAYADVGLNSLNILDVRVRAAIGFDALPVEGTEKAAYLFVRGGHERVALYLGRSVVELQLRSGDMDTARVLLSDDPATFVQGVVTDFEVRGTAPAVFCLRFYLPDEEPPLECSASWEVASSSGVADRVVIGTSVQTGGALFVDDVVVVSFDSTN
jgi:cysteine-rich repeat protein